jgi:hypothetical protein
MEVVLAALMSIAVLVAGMFERPTVARCPGKWSVEGVRRTGDFACHAPLPRGCGEPKGPEVPCPRMPRIEGRLYCDGSSIPVVTDAFTVRCIDRRARS